MLSLWEAPTVFGAQERPDAPPAPQGSSPVSPPESNGFAVTTILVEGNTLLSKAKIEEILEKHKGQNRTMQDLEQARSELEKAYSTAGYPTVLVNIPEQTIEQGTITLQVVEGRLGAIKITSN